MPQADQAAKLRQIADRLKTNRKTARKILKPDELPSPAVKAELANPVFPSIWLWF